MRNTSVLVRLIPLALAAFASVATSQMPSSLECSQPNPPAYSTNVSPDIHPEFVVYRTDTSIPLPPVGALTLRDTANNIVSGTPERAELSDGSFVYRFIPSAPLWSGDFKLSLGVPTTSIGLSDGLEL